MQHVHDRTTDPGDIDAPGEAASDMTEAGQGMIEYAFILMLVALLLILSVQFLGHQTSNMYSNVAHSFPQ
jgi:Flp pilus assembly pilin Flp